VPKQVTMKDIAEALGVSVSTVGRALADQPEIGEATKKRVREMAAKLNYIRHSSARMMRTGHSSLIGLVIPHIKDSFMADCASAISKSCEAAGFQLILAVTENDPDQELHHVRAMLEARAAGMIITACETPLPETLALIARIPTVQLIQNNRAIQQAWFGIDDRQGVYDATRHLLVQGHREIAYIGSTETFAPGAAQLEGFKEAFHEIGIDWPRHLTRTIPPETAAGKTALGQILDNFQPSAVIGGRPNITCGLLHEIVDRGLNVPNDISVIGYGDLPWFQWWGLGLTVMTLPAYDLAYAGSNYLLQTIEKNTQARIPENHPRYRAMHGPNLVVRGSTKVI